MILKRKLRNSEGVYVNLILLVLHSIYDRCTLDVYKTSNRHIVQKSIILRYHRLIEIADSPNFAIHGLNF